MWAIFSFTFLECLSLQTAFRQQADYKLKNETVWQLHAKRLQQGILPFGGIDLVTAETKLSHPLRDTGKSGDFFPYTLNVHVFHVTRGCGQVEVDKRVSLRIIKDV